MAVFYTQNAGLALLFYTDYESIDRLPSLGTTEQGS